MVGHSAFAQQNFGLTSESDWKVTRIDAKSPTGKPYCVMASRFTKDVILSLAQNPTGSSSLALDFQSPKLVEGAEYDLTLIAGGNVNRDFRVRPVSKEAFVVRLAFDPEFMEALKVGQSLNFEFKQSSLTFDLKGISTGFDKLAECVQELPAEKQEVAQNAEPAADVTAATPVVTLENVKDTPSTEIQPVPAPVKTAPAPEVMAKVQLPRAPESKPASISAPPRDTIIAKAPSVNAPTASYSASGNVSKPESLLKKPAPVDSSIVSLRQENESLKMALNEAQRKLNDFSSSNIGNSAQLSEMKEKIVFLEAQNEKLNAALGSVKATSKPNKDLIAQNEELQNDLKSYKERLTMYQERVATLEEELRNTAQLAQTDVADNKEFEALKASLSAKEIMIEKLQSEKDALVANAAAADSEMEKQLAEENGKLKAQLAALEEKLQKVSSQDFSEDVVALSRQVKDLNKRYFETKANLEAQVARLEEDKKSLQAQMSFSENNREQLSQTEDRMRELQEENQVLLERVASLEVDRLSSIAPGAGLASFSGKDVETMDQQITQLRKENMKLISQINTMKSAPGDREYCTSSENWNLDKATGRYQEAQREIIRLGQALKDQRKKCAKTGNVVASTLLDPRLSSGTQKQLYEALKLQMDDTQALLDEQKERYEAQILALKQQITGLRDPSGYDVASLTGSASASDVPDTSVTAVQVKKNDVFDYPADSTEAIANQLISNLANVEPAAGDFRADVSNDVGRYDAGNGAAPISLTSGQASGGGAGSNNQYGNNNMDQPYQIKPVAIQAAPVNNGGGMNAGLGYSNPFRSNSNGGMANNTANNGYGAYGQQPSQYPAPRGPMGQQMVQQPVQQQAQQPAAFAPQSSGQSELSGLLTRANIPVQGMIFELSAPNDENKSFRWDTGNMLGSADYIQVPNPQYSTKFFNDVVKMHIEKIKTRCDGRFSSRLNTGAGMRSDDVLSYDIVCEGSESGQETYASVVFVNQKNRLAIFKHESNNKDIAQTRHAAENLASAL